MPSAAELVANPEGLITLPAVYVRLRSLVDDHRSSLHEIARVIATDASIAARTLRIANSAFFGLPGRIDSLPTAVRILGIQQIHDLVLASAVARAVRELEGVPVRMETFWRTSVHAGVLARLLAGACNVLDSERLFVEGLLHDLGHLILYQRVPALASAAHARAESSGEALHRVERDLIGCDYAQVGGALLASWKLPESIRESVGLHPEPARARTFPLEAAIVHIAAAAARAPGLPGEAVAERIDAAAWRITHLAPGMLDEIALEAEAHLESAVDLIRGGKDSAAA